MSERQNSRELLIQCIFQMSLTGDFSEDQKITFAREHTDGAGMKKIPDKKYFNRGITAVRDHIETIDEAVEAASDHWKVDRIAKVDLAILRVATAEIRYMPDIPAGVSVNEAVELAKKFGGDGSFRYINGVLGKIIREQSMKPAQKSPEAI
ncbi:MAG: transcription antitermination factor NusB [Clostridiales Family XIII bacterium]|jgi:N utilization substance protein B|nr:transcription antitermination factor NusB [Clostridiales Family XIII bacterium]